MRKLLYIIGVAIALLRPQTSIGQLCDPATPVFTVNLSGNPNGTWISPTGTREGLCCSATSPDVCIEFIITLDSAAKGINFGIASGAVPPGALYYQIDCGTPTEVGQPICLDGPGPYHLTFCKPGNNQNSYAITSFGEPEITAKISDVVSPQCTAVLSSPGINIDEASITWTSIPFNTTYNSFLSCTTGCDTVIVSPSGNLPPYVDYMVCGSSNGPCASGSACDTVRVYFFNDVIVSVTPPNVTLCDGVTATSITSSVSGGSGAYQYLWSNGQTSQNIVAGAGTYTLTVSDTAICSTASASTTITVLPPIVANAGSDVTVCENASSVVLNGSIQTATAAAWTGGSGTFNPNNTSLNAVYTPSASEIMNGFVNLVLQTTANQGCPPGSDTIQIIISQLPNPSVAGNLVVCANTGGIYSTPTEAGCTYAWSVTGGTINGAANSNSINVTWGNSGSGTATVTVTNSSGCVATANATVSISSPVIANAGTDVIVCGSQTSVALSASVQNATAYSWTGGNGTFNPNNTSLNALYTPSASEIQNGFANLVLVTTANPGCPPVYDTLQVTISSLPDPSLVSGNITACSNNTGIYSAALQAGCTYAWSVTGGTINGPANSNSISITWGNAGSGTVALTVTNSSGCVSSANTTITIASPVIANAGTDVMVCGGQSPVVLNGTVQNAMSFSWTGGNGTFSPNNTTLNAMYTPSAFEIQNGYANLILSSTPNAGCPAVSDTIHITIAPVPDPSISGNLVACSNSTGNYSVAVDPGCSYSWTVTGGTINGSAGSNAINITWGSGGAGTVSVTVTNNSGCSATAMQNVSLVVLPNPVFSGTGTICQYSSGIYSVSSTTGSTYAWSVINGTISGSNSGSSVAVNWNTTGNGSITLVETNSFGCSQSYTMPLTIFQQPVPAIAGNGIICSNSPQATYTSPFINNTTYSWNVTGGTIVATNGSNSIDVIWNTGGTNAVSLTVSNSSGCDSTMTLPVTISVVNPPSVQSTGKEGCPPLSVTFSGNMPAPGQTYSWSFGDQLYSSAPNPQHTYSSPGTYNLQVVTQTGNGCFDSASATVRVYEVPDASFSHNFENTVYYIGESVLEIFNTSTGATSYLWTFGTGDTANVFQPNNTYLEAGDYVIELITVNSSGCPDRTTREIRVRNHEHVYVPNAFTPNGDNTNDYFSMLYSNIESASVSIFNRWGQNFFTSDDKDFKWDGTYAGDPVEIGVYVYRIMAVGEGGKAYTFIGTVTVTR